VIEGFLTHPSEDVSVNTQAGLCFVGIHGCAPALLMVHTT
jgi:hypothetical protein